MILIEVSLATMMLVGVALTAIPWTLTLYARGVVGLFISTVLTWIAVAEWTHREIVLSFAAAGLASVMQEVKNLLAVIADNERLGVLKRTAARR